jgi:hypothetical protein
MTPEQQKALTLATARLRLQKIQSEELAKPLPDASASFLSQMGRNIPEVLDLGGAAVASTADYMGGGNESYWKGFMQPAMTPASDLTDAVVGKKYEPKTTLGTIAGFGGGLVGLGAKAEVLQGAPRTMGFMRGVLGKVERPKTPEQLQELYTSGRGAMKEIPLDPNAIRAGLYDKLVENGIFSGDKLKRYSNTQLPKYKDQMAGYANKGTTADNLEEYRVDLSNLPSNLAQPIRQGIDVFYEGANIPSDFRQAYGLMRRGESAQEMIDAANTVTAKQGALKKFAAKTKGLNPADREELKRLAESGAKARALDIAASGTGWLTAGLGLGGNVGGALVAGGTRGLLRTAAENAKLARIQQGVDMVKAGGKPLSFYEKLGLSVNEFGSGVVGKALKRK